MNKKIEKLQPFEKKYEIKWRDSRIFNMQEPKQDFEVAIIYSIGFVIQEDSTKIVLARDLIDDDYRGVIVIPRENIITIK